MRRCCVNSYIIVVHPIQVCIHVHLISIADAQHSSEVVDIGGVLIGLVMGSAVGDIG